MTNAERTKFDRHLADVGEFLARYAWTDQHDESHGLYDRIRKAREYIDRDSKAAQGASR